MTEEANSNSSKNESRRGDRRRAHRDTDDSDDDEENVEVIKISFLPKVLIVRTLAGFVVYNHNEDVETFRLDCFHDKDSDALMLRITLRRLTHEESKSFRSKPLDVYRLMLGPRDMMVESKIHEQVDQCFAKISAFMSSQRNAGVL